MRRAGVSAKHAEFKLTLATYQPSLRVSQDDSIFPSLANLKGTGIIERRISSLRQRCSNPKTGAHRSLYSEGSPQTRSCHGVLGWQPGSHASDRRCDAVSYPLRQDEYCHCGHSDPRSADLPGADIATHLTRHGVNATVVRIPVSKIDVSNTILSYAAEAGADLIVMGGYGHSRLREFILGGTTRGMLASMTKPTLMSH